MKSLRVTLWGKLVARFLPYRKHIILTNIEQVYGDQLSPSQKHRLMQAFYSHILTAIRETLFLRCLSPKQLSSKVVIKGHERVIELAEAGRGVLLLTGHFGSFEFAPIAGIQQFKQFKGQFHFIRKRLGRGWLEKKIYQRYSKSGLHVITKANALTQVTQALLKNHAVVFVLDQHASTHNRDGIAVEFFGEPAGTYRSLATFAREQATPVVPTQSYRLPSGQHVLEFHAPIEWVEHPKNHQAIYLNTLAYNQALEKMVLSHPEQWWWFHKRWKLTPQKYRNIKAH